MRRGYVIAAGLAFLLLIFWLIRQDRMADEAAVIGGEVTWVARPGDEVTEGSELLRVAALSGGEAVAARSRWHGVVRETRVVPGDRVASGTVVVRIEKR